MAVPAGALEPGEWRRLLGPVGAWWLVALQVGTVGRRLGGTDLVAATVDAVRQLLARGPAVVGTVLVLALLIWAAGGLVAYGCARALAWWWLGRWPGGPLLAWRRKRWERENRAMVAAEKAGDDAAAARHIIRRSAVALTPPRRPTWMGDRWASLAARVDAAYGLDLISAWPRLWLLLSTQDRAELRRCESDWHHAANWAGWGVLYLCTGVLWWPAACVGVLIGLAAWSRARSATAAYTTLVEATFDLYAGMLAARLGVVSNPDRLEMDDGLRVNPLLRKGA